MKQQLYIFGAGQNGKRLLEYLREIETIEVVAFIDNDPIKQRKKLTE